MAKAIESQGVKIAYSDGGSPTSYSNIGNIVGFDGLGGGSAAVIDVSNLDSTMKEKLIGLGDEGQLGLDINWDPDNVTHIALRAARLTRTRLEFRVTLSDATPATAVFFGYVMTCAVSGAVNQAVKGKLTIEIDGAVAWN